ncbi:ECF-type riboflavin transporter, S component [Bifidobacterium thermophilum]|nr:ECF-type riboflavin transporter, S component [Bifidobacterium thermophilum]
MAAQSKTTFKASMIPLIAIMTALTTVMTMLVKLPTPTRGYLNLSDAMIFFSAYAFGPWVGGVIGGLGPALSDLLSGYPQWAVFTFIIDGLQAVFVGLIVRKFRPANMIAGSVIAGVWKVFGYFIAGGILSGWGPALGEVAGNAGQMAVGLIIAYALFAAVRKAYPPLVRMGNLGVQPTVTIPEDDAAASNQQTGVSDETATAKPDTHAGADH